MRRVGKRKGPRHESLQLREARKLLFVERAQACTAAFPWLYERVAVRPLLECYTEAHTEAQAGACAAVKVERC